MLELTISPTVSEIVSAKVAPFIVIASAFKVPSISASPEISNVAASSSPDKVILVAPVIAPSSATAPLISIVVAAIWTSVSATISNCPSVDELIYKAESLKRSLLVLFKVKPVPSVCVKVVSESAQILIRLNLILK